MIILDFGSATTCKNDPKEARRMIEALALIVPRSEEVVIKWQLFKDIPPLEPLKWDVFREAYKVAEYYELQTTASVFDRESLDYLLTYDVPFVKIACRPHLYPLIDEVLDENVPVVVSVNSPPAYNKLREDKSWIGKTITGEEAVSIMCCVPEYPASPTKYEVMFSGLLHYGLSDHTVGTYLYERYQPLVWEKHFCLDDSTGPDAAAFAIRPTELKEVLCNCDWNHFRVPTWS